MHSDNLFNLILFFSKSATYSGKAEGEKLLKMQEKLNMFLSVRILFLKFSKYFILWPSFSLSKMIWIIVYRNTWSAIIFSSILICLFLLIISLRIVPVFSPILMSVSNKRVVVILIYSVQPWFNEQRVFSISSFKSWQKLNADGWVSWKNNTS